MKPTKFKHCNVTFAEDQPEYMPLPALRIDSPEGQVISCWKMSFRERIKALFTGRIWLRLVSFNKPLTPSYMSVNRKDVFVVNGESDKRQLKRIVKDGVALFNQLKNQSKP